MFPKYRHTPIFDPERKRCPVCDRGRLFAGGHSSSMCDQADDPPGSRGARSRSQPGLQLSSLLRRRADIPGTAAAGVQLQPGRNDLRAGGLDGDGRGRDPPAARDQAGQGGQALPGDPHLFGLAVTEPRVVDEAPIQEWVDRDRPARSRPARVFYQSLPFLVMLWSVGLTTEWHRWLFPIRSLLPSLASPTQRASTEAPFFSTLKASRGSSAFRFGVRSWARSCMWAT